MNMTPKRYDRQGRDVTNTPGLWSDEDISLTSTAYPHPDITSGQKPCGPETMWVRMHSDGGNWVNTGHHSWHKVLQLWIKEGERAFIPF